MGQWVHKTVLEEYGIIPPIEKTVHGPSPGSCPTNMCFVLMVLDKSLEEAGVTGEQLMSVEGFTDRGYKLPAHLEI